MQNHVHESLKIKSFSIILASAFALSTLGYGPISAWAQESSTYPGQGIQNAPPPPNGMNPCFLPRGNYTGMHHFGGGNYTGNGMHNFGQGNYTGMHHFGQGNYTGMHHMRQGNYTGNGMHPCSGQIPNKPGNGNNIVPQGTTTTSSTNGTQAPMPSWIKNNAKWWSSGAIDDNTFAQGIQYMIQQKIIKIPPTQSSQATSGVKIPSWIKNDAAYWSSNQIDDSTFVKAIQYLVQTGIISS